jgi:acyl carrier protein
LQAYVTVLTPIDESTLRTFLAERLPAYMLPYQILVLGTIPLTANGKVDRKKLLALAHDENTTHAVLNPRNETEERLLVIWKEVLGTSELGVTDNFFDRGGNSLKIVKMVWLIERAFGKKISVVMAFKFYNVESLAAYIDSYDDDISEEGHDMIESIAQMENTLNLLNENTNEE